MNVSREQVILDLIALFNKENVITEAEVLKEYDTDNLAFPKAHGIYAAPLPICILNVFSTEEISKALKYCNTNKVAVIARTGGSSYEKLLSAVTEDTIMIDASGMNKILSIDEYNMVATAQCGVSLKVLEDLLQAKGLTTGHCPQSQPIAQMGGLLATRSIGQFSTLYGAIEDMVLGLEAVMPNGEVVRIRNVPRRASGPDLRHLFIGSEGALAFITEASIKLFSYYPNDFWMNGYIVNNMDEGFRIIRNVIAAGYKPSVVRLYDKEDLDYNFGSVFIDDGKAYMFFIAEGPAVITKATGEGIEAIVNAEGAESLGDVAVKHWYEHRNDLCDYFGSPQLRMLYKNYPFFYATTEISASYSDIAEIYHNVKTHLPEKIPQLTLLGGHVSHAYQTGVNVYFVYQFSVEDPKNFDSLHQSVIDAIVEEVLKTPTGGAVHHHGMGKQRVKFAPIEHGTSYFLMKEIKDMMDPNGIMNPGNLIEWK